MKTRIHCVLVVLSLLSTLNSQFSTARARGTAFTCQVRLDDGRNPANGSNALFTAALEFGSQFPAVARWLEIPARTHGRGGLFHPEPAASACACAYAITAGNAVSSGVSSGTCGNAVTFNNANHSISGVFTGNGAERNSQQIQDLNYRITENQNQTKPWKQIKVI